MWRLPEWKDGSVVAAGRGRRRRNVSVTESLCKRIVLNLELSELRVERKSTEFADFRGYFSSCEATCIPLGFGRR